MRLIAAASFWLVLSTCATGALAWGDGGHEIVCQIALQEMQSRDARDELRRLMRAYHPHADELRTQRFDVGCTYPDHPHTRPPAHYVNLRRTATQLTRPACPSSREECVVSAIESDLAALRNRGRSDEDRARALMFLGHWLGDLHQPLHVSFKDDRGGNKIRALGHACVDVNLHFVWDDCLVLRIEGRDSVEAVSRRLRAKLTAQKRRDWAGWDHWNSALLADWASESFAIATSANVGYCERAGAECVGRTMIVIDSAYLAKNTPTAETRLLQAGVRLARILDEALAKP